MPEVSAHRTPARPFDLALGADHALHDKEFWIEELRRFDFLVRLLQRIARLHRIRERAVGRAQVTQHFHVTLADFLEDC